MSNIRTVFEFGAKYLRQYWGRLMAGVLLGLICGLTNASFVWATKTLIDRLKGPETVAQQVTVPVPVKSLGAWSQQLDGIKQGADRWIEPWLPRRGRVLDWRQMLGALLFLPLLVSVRSSTDYLSSYCMGWVSERVINDLRLDVLAKLSALSLDFFTRSSTGDLLTRINSDTGKLLRCLKLGAADLVKETVSMVSVLGALLWINWQLTLVTAVFMPLCLFPLLVLGRKARRASKASLNAEVLQSSQLVELLASIRVVKAYNLEQEQLRRYRALSKDLVHFGMKGIQAKELVNPIIEVISMLGLGFLILYIFRTQGTAGDFVGFLTGVMLFFLPVKKLAGVHIAFEQASVAVQRLADILREQPSVREPIHPKALGPFRSEIRFEKVSFAYRDRLVLRDVKLVIPSGTRVGVAGPSGSGKSTLVNLLFRFYDPTQGAIRIDGIDLRDASLREIRQVMALVSQEVVVFDATVAENIACGKPGATPAEIEAAARAAYAHEFIRDLPEGYATRVGERGVTLSGGQRQRLAIARAFIRNAPILVLDEATASLDSQAETEVQLAIERLEQNRTVISVAHRLSTLAGCDQIVVLSEGAIIEQDSFKRLITNGGAFADMARRQGILS
jgi:ATP-binding cassette, subfamily B, bacterial MsbA